jgi:hypothetical protein
MAQTGSIRTGMKQQPPKQIPSLCIASKPSWACVVASDKLGYGVWSWHSSKADAEHNASILDGRAVPVDYHNGQIIIPPLAKTAVNKFFLLNN